MQLIYHPPAADSSGVSAVFADTIKAMLFGSKGEVQLVSPFLNSTVLENIILGRQFRLITDVAACIEAIAANADEVRALAEFFAQHMEYIRHRPKVHAKVIVTNSSGLIGSANLTKKGFGERDEMACIFKEPEHVDELQRWFSDLWDGSAPITPDLLERLPSAAAKRREAMKDLPGLPQPDGRPRPKRSHGGFGDPTSDWPKPWPPMDKEIERLGLDSQRGKIIVRLMREPEIFQVLSWRENDGVALRNYAERDQRPSILRGKGKGPTFTLADVLEESIECLTWDEARRHGHPDTTPEKVPNLEPENDAFWYQFLAELAVKLPRPGVGR